MAEAAPRSPTPTLAAALAAELDGAAAAIERLAERLCADRVVFERHAGPLQDFDHVAQVIAEIATLLRRPDDGVGGVRLEAMRGRLTGGMQAVEG